MVPREAASHLARLSSAFPVVGLTGPRQSGKTTLVRALYAHLPYVSLENPQERTYFDSDPEGFLARFPDGAVFDEAQRSPDLFSYLQGMVDQRPRDVTFVLTGSQQFFLMSRITQTLAGRIAFVRLMPFSYAELLGGDWTPSSLDELCVRGQYPAVWDRDLDAGDWFPNYMQTYVERDVRQILNVQDLATFQSFVRLCAGRVGQLVNLTSLGDDCGVSYHTARSWLTVLETSYVIGLLRPHHRNYRKRITKSPKLYFLDTGLACWLLGIRDANVFASHPMRGALMENWVVSELMKLFVNDAGWPSSLYFWRDHAGHEVDVIVDRGEWLQPVEIKAGRTVTSDQIAGLRWWTQLAGDSAREPTLVYGGEDGHVRSGFRVIGWRDVGSLGPRHA